MLNQAHVESLRVGTLTISASLLVRAAQDLGLSYKLFPGRLVRISNNKSSFYFKGTSMPVNDSVASRVSSDKYLARAIFKEHGIPVPRTVTVRTASQWEQGLKGSLRLPLVVKPVSASHANGATMNIRSGKELRKAVQRAFAHIKKTKQGDRALIEEYVSGEDLRLFVIGSKVVSVILREPAYVVGDGVRSIRELIADYNALWKSSIKYDLPLCPIPVDTEVYRKLHSQGLRLRSIPKYEEKVHVRWNANVSTGGRTMDVTDVVHDAIKQVAVRSAQALHLQVAGVDILCKDKQSADITENNIVVLEANDAPGVDIHHLPYKGQGRDVAKMILEYVFKIEHPKDIVEAV